MGWSGFGLGLLVGLTCVLYVVSLYHFLCFYVLESLSCWWGKDGYLDVVLLYYVVILCTSREPTTHIRNPIKRHLCYVVVPDVRMLAHRAVDVAKSLEQSLRNGR